MTLAPNDPRHGMRSTYIHHGCRCVACTAANTAGCMAAKNRRELPADDPRHGTDTAYDNWRCRCDRCRAAKSVRNAGRPTRARSA